MGKFIKTFFACALLIGVGYIFCDIASTDGWGSGLFFLVMVSLFLFVILTPVLFVRAVRREPSGRAVILTPVLFVRAVRREPSGRETD
jgi:hypothetical protein